MLGQGSNCPKGNRKGGRSHFGSRKEDRALPALCPTLPLVSDIFATCPVRANCGPMWPDEGVCVTQGV